VETFGRPGAYVARDLVMQRVNMVDSEHFILMAEYLEKGGWIAQAHGKLHKALDGALPGRAVLAVCDDRLVGCPLSCRGTDSFRRNPVH
jgi:hypothetical protein